MKKVCLLVILFSFTLPMERINSSDKLKVGINGKDDRVIFSLEGHPWDAIGQVNVSGYRRITRCTGTLVAPDRVITAAHCLVDQKTGAKWPLNSIHFVAGVRGELFKSHATAKCIKFMKDYELRFEKKDHKFFLKEFENDAAVIILTHSLEVQPVSLQDIFEEKPGQHLLHVAYPTDRRFIPSAHINCQLEKIEPNSVIWSTNCDSSPGSSGGPLFTMTQNTIQLTAIMVGAGKYNYALPASVWKNLIFEKTCF